MRNIEIQFNVPIIKKLKSYYFQADQLGSVLLILFCLYEQNMELLDEFDDFNKQRKVLFLYKELEIRNLIFQNTELEKETPHFQLTKEGLALIEFIKSEFNKSNKEVTSTDLAVKGVGELKQEVLSEDDPEVWIEEWIKIFPEGLKNAGGLVRGDKTGCLKKMKVFLREYPFKKDTIFKATKMYIESKRLEGFSFIRRAIYFIYRIDGHSRNEKVSDLAAWCEEAEKKQDNKNTGNNLEIMA